MSNLNEIDEIIQNHGKDGLRFLFLFKILKVQVESELRKEGKNIDDSFVNEVCASAAKELLIVSEEIPTEAEISKALQRLKEKLELLD